MSAVKHPVMWFKGLPVGPEIFQQNALYNESLLKSYFKYIFPIFWGVSSIEYEENELSNGQFKLKKLQAFSADYTYFEIDEESNLSIDLEKYKDELKEKPLYIYISTPANEYTEQKNVTSSRYSTTRKEVFDLNNKEEKAEVVFLKPNIFLEIAQTNSLQNISIPLFKIMHNGMNYQLTDYCFPTCFINNSSKITKQITSLVTLMKDKINFLKNNSNSIENTMLLTSVSTMLFSLERCIKSNVHPYELYTSLVDAVGNTFTFAQSNKIPKIPEYKHEDVYGSIKELVKYIHDNVKAISVACIKYKFEQDSFNNGPIFTITPNIEMKNDLLIIGVERNKAATYNQTQEWITDAIIASTDNLLLTQEQRTIGARRSLITNLEELNIPQIENMIVFGIKLDTDFITASENICILNLNNTLLPPASIYMIQTMN